MTENAQSQPDGDRIRAKIAELIDEVGEEVAGELAQSFLSDIPDTERRITDAVQQNNFVELRRSAHSYKSLAQFYGLDSVSTLARELELAAEAQANEKIAPLHSEFLVENQYAWKAILNEFETGFQITLEPPK